MATGRGESIVFKEKVGEKVSLKENTVQRGGHACFDVTLRCTFIHNGRSSGRQEEGYVCACVCVHELLG